MGSVSLGLAAKGPGFASVRLVMLDTEKNVAECIHVHPHSASACLHVCVRACMRACMRACVGVGVSAGVEDYQSFLTPGRVEDT